MNNQNSEKILEVPVVIFTMNERTKSLAVKCFQVLGFKNIIIFDQEEGFSEKMKRFFELSNLKEYENTELFIRSDADRLVFAGIKDLANESFKYLENSKDGMLLSEGFGYECFMARLRGATPHIYSKNIMKYILENSETLIKDIQKPESHIGKHAKETLDCFKPFNILTNLHEFEQYPSKMFHAFLNRINRGHIGYYDLEVIQKNSLYGPAMKLALNASKTKNKESMSYSDKELSILSDLDTELGPILEKTLSDFYILYTNLFNFIKEKSAASFKENK